MSDISPIPKHQVAVVQSKKGETFMIGRMQARVMEDGTNTDNRISVLELTIPPHTNGPPSHYHMMHDETFLVTQGTVRFVLPPAATSGSMELKVIDASTGDYVVVPIEAPHTFSNPFDEEAKFFNTSTPAFYVDYFRLINRINRNSSEGKTTPEDGRRAMGRYATLPASLPRSDDADSVTASRS